MKIIPKEMEGEKENIYAVWRCNNSYKKLIFITWFTRYAVNHNVIIYLYSNNQSAVWKYESYYVQSVNDLHTAWFSTFY